MSHARAHIHRGTTPGQRIADLVTGFVGSWLFIWLHVAWFGLWIGGRVEPFPFGLLTMVVSLEAIFLSTFVMMAGNRSAARDRLRDDHEAREVSTIHTLLTRLDQVNATQLEILHLLREKVIDA